MSVEWCAGCGCGHLEERNRFDGTKSFGGDAGVALEDA